MGLAQRDEDITLKGFCKDDSESLVDKKHHEQLCASRGEAADLLLSCDSLTHRGSICGARSAVWAAVALPTALGTAVLVSQEILL